MAKNSILLPRVILDQLENGHNLAAMLLLSLVLSLCCSRWLSLLLSLLFSLLLALLSRAALAGCRCSRRCCFAAAAASAAAAAAAAASSPTWGMIIPPLGDDGTIIPLKEHPAISDTQTSEAKC